MSDVDRLRRTLSLPDTALSFGVKLTKDGEEFVGCCPFHREDTPSFTVFRGKDGVERFQCFGCGERGDVVDLVKGLKGVDTREAIKILGGARPDRADISPRVIEQVDNYAGISPVAPAGQMIRAGERVRLYNPKRKGSPREWGEISPSLVHPYRLTDRSLFGYVLRHDLSDGGKETPMVMWVRLPGGRECWCRFPFPKPRPLYGLDRIDATRQVIVVEGEKCRDFLHRATGRNFISWAGGTQGVKWADWSPLAGRDVILWRDNDAPGIRAMDEVGSILSGLGCRVRAFNVERTAQ